ncbi:MAG: protein-L-isoaspartate(D-aspartate) O-methyltransferase [Chloroflexota bacterium]
MFSKIKRKASAAAHAVFLALQIAALVQGAQNDPRRGEKADEFVEARRLMVERQLRWRGIKDERVLAAMQAVPRHLFVPERLRAFAYDDRPLPIGSDQTVSQPYIVALMTELLELRPADKVLEIGTGSGYQTAVLAQLVAAVYSIEILPGLAESAKKILAALGSKNVELKIGDGFYGWPEHAPFDAVLVTAAAPKIPELLWRELREGGRLIMPLGEEGQTQKLIRARKVAGEPMIEDFSEVLFVPLRGAIQK